jgi:hypothetical protein
MIDAILLDCEQTEGGTHLLLTEPSLGTRVDYVPFYELERTDLSACRGLLIGLHADQRYLAAHRPQLEAFLRGGGTIVVCGHIAHPFLAELAPFRPIPNYRLEDLMVNREAEHPVWSGVDPADLEKRRGVAGFYGRGANPPPPGALVVNSLGPGRHPVDFECRPAVGGRLLVHAGTDLWGYLDAGTTAERITPQLLNWIAETSR